MQAKPTTTKGRTKESFSSLYDSTPPRTHLDPIFWIRRHTMRLCTRATAHVARRPDKEKYRKDPPSHWSSPKHKPVSRPANGKHRPCIPATFCCICLTRHRSIPNTQWKNPDTQETPLILNFRYCTKRPIRCSPAKLSPGSLAENNSINSITSFVL